MVKKSSERVFARLNRALLVFIVLCNAYVLLSPFMPEISFQLRQIQPVKSEIKLSELDVSRNLLVIPKLNMSEEILEGEGIETVNRGVWRRPQTSTPDKGSNTVLVGHRFTYDGASVFYHLDKLDIGDDISVIWNGKLKNYKITDERVVPATAVEVEDPTVDEILTLYTCTPLWSAIDRLVYTAIPEEKND